MTDVCCVVPPIDDLQLLAVIDDEADPAILEHLRICPACAARVHDYAELQQQLRKKLYRAFCPTSDELAAFQQGLKDGQYIRIWQHVATCPHCTKELAILAALFTAQIPRQ